MTAQLVPMAAFLLLVAGCGETGTSAADAGSAGDTGLFDDAGTPPDGGDSANPTDCMPPVHPGTVTYVNGDTGEVRVQAVDASNESSFWVMTAAGRVPIVKLVYRRLDDRTAEIKSFGPCDQLLEVTIGTT